MNGHRVRAVAKRIVLGFRRDRRSLGLLFVAPVVVLSLVGAVWGVATERAPVAEDVHARRRREHEPILGTEQLETADEDAARRIHHRIARREHGLVDAIGQILEV